MGISSTVSEVTRVHDTGYWDITLSPEWNAADLWFAGLDGKRDLAVTCELRRFHHTDY